MAYAARLVFPGYKFGIDDPAEALALVELGVGGFCLYGGEPGEIRELTRRLQGAAKAPLLFCADYEDGLPSQCPGGTALPPNMALGAAGSEELAFRKGAITAVEARAVGVAWVLGPVVDLATRPENPIVNVRAFGADPAQAARLARAYIKGLKSGGALSCLKHFPGHGETAADSHLELPGVDVPKEVLERRELVPYRELAREADTVMTGHLLVAALEQDAKTPISLSSAVARTLRASLGFEGLVSTDALSMHAVAQNFTEDEAAAMALLGGSDILLVPADPRRLVYSLLEKAEADPRIAQAVSASSARLERAVKTAQSVPDPDLSRVGCAEHSQAAKAMAEACLAWEGPRLKSPVASFAYFEPDADAPEDWQGQAFVSAMRRGGAELSETAETLVVGCHLRPQAWTGRIRYEPELVDSIRQRTAKARAVVVVSFGSPFVFDQLGAGGLCAFSGSVASQEAAAAVLRGALKIGR